MQTRNSFIAAAIAGALSLTTAGLVLAGDADKESKEKCYGIAKAGKNDCAANGHACAGQSKVDGQASEWIYVPAGTCERIVNGSTTSGK